MGETNGEGSAPYGGPMNPTHESPDNSPPRDDELEALAREDVCYEIGMFLYTATRITQPVSDDDRNALRESMLVHARCLMDFLACDPRKDDLSADRYADWAPEIDGGVELAWLEENLGTMIDKRVAHLTAYRQRVPKDPTLFVQTIVRHMGALIPRFLDKLHPDKVGWFATVRQV